MRFPDFRHFIVEAGAGNEAVGFVILQGCRNPHGVVELKRMVLQPKGHGLGAPACGCSSGWPSATCGAHRFWLDVKPHNTRAVALYASEGFVEEGRLRESVRVTLAAPRLRLADRHVHARARIRRARALGLEPA